MDRRVHPMSALLAALLAIMSAAPAFAPPVERPITLTVAETRTLDGAESRFATTRRVVFHARDGGYVADVDTLSASGEAANASSAIAEAGLSALIGRRMTITLDGAGQPLAVADREALWTHVVDAIADAIRRRKPGRAPGSADPAPVVMLRSLPPERQLAMLASTLSPLIDPKAAATETRALHPITLTMRAPDGVATPLTGTERSERTADGHILTTRELNGGSADRRVTFRLTQRADPATGLVLDTSQTTEIESDAGTVRQVRTFSATIG
ncbi:hypothetical protein LZK98_08010 [Sphingomonas cannabina]|uniref:hypothetical protein n=1 Tax=Sphingomonas cannabina TaxID=2899123 RepID=UPI001F48C7C7|nr:hypothetical protein [Sphingomonas cannabina]UIJ46875.1 hypothetical protein LZK98_08010 [Sphingomonas cannabina]